MEQGTSADDGVSSAVPVKLCECGCGRPAPIALRAITRRGVAKGQPLRFIWGHNGRGVPRPRIRLPETPQMVKLCECGCGQPAPTSWKNNRRYGYVRGQPMRFIAGHTGGNVMQPPRPRPGRVAQFVRLCECGCGYPTEIAGRGHASSGLVKGQPNRLIRGHQVSVNGPGARKRQPFIEVGQRFGSTAVTDLDALYVAPNGRSRRAVGLLCDCGTEFVRKIESVLRSPDIQSCDGCTGPGDLTGRQFGRLTVVQWIPGDASAGGGGAWRCKCDCGNEVTCLTRQLLRGHHKSCGCGRSGPRNGPAFRATLNKYQANARDRGLPWNLTEDDFLRLTSLDCYYCGGTPANAHGTFVHNGLDRVDNAQGYELANIVPCCKICNHAKGTMSYSDFLAWIARVASFHFFRPDMTPVSLLKPSA